MQLRPRFTGPAKQTSSHLLVLQACYPISLISRYQFSITFSLIDIVGDVGYSWACEGKYDYHHVIFVTILPLSHNPLC